ncbi:MFS transporter [Bosea sp. Root670]|uniref:MFS transporter n=1 Tax=unclassified Bosea (in: a-proteobacteria) TaxID=2653178 RepID=UPI0007143849|nr:MULTISPECIES: MFS transporter [unclassified Bosea (in: a-proteobacteria)]KRE00812.1 MFS transporter [Bosea sp. Root670]TQI74051.1 putative MFS family arabinose efflux permease [Bosea sp. AK1]
MTERSRLTVISALGVVQILAWGSSYYLSAVLAAPIADDTGWPLSWVIGALSIGLLTAGAIAPLIGRVIGERGGRPVLAAAALLLAAGQVILGLSPNLPIFIAGWVVIGAGMAAGLYDAAFSTLGRLYGGTARSAITVLTLWGGFASTVCWPLSAYMVAQFGWRETCFAYAAIQLLISLPLVLTTVPPAAIDISQSARTTSQDIKLAGNDRSMFLLLAGLLVIGGAIGSIVGVQLLTLLQAQGITLAAAVALGVLVGPAQVGGRVIEMAGKGKHHPLWTMTAALVLVALGLGLLTFGLGPVSMAILLYGAGNGVFSIAKGIVPLALFGADRYAPIVGRLARPSLVAQALAPAASAWILEHAGVTGAYGTLLLLAAANVVLCLGLWASFRAKRP